MRWILAQLCCASTRWVIACGWDYTLTYYRDRRGRRCMLSVRLFRYCGMDCSINILLNDILWICIIVYWTDPYTQEAIWNYQVLNSGDNKCNTSIIHVINNFLAIITNTFHAWCAPWYVMHMIRVTTEARYDARRECLRPVLICSVCSALLPCK